MTQNRIDGLLASIDRLLARHSDANPELLKDIRELRIELLRLRQQKRLGEFATIALRVAAAVKFIYDLWPPDQP